MRQITILLLLNIFFSAGQAQKHLDVLRTKLLTADSVVLVSHLDIGMQTVDKETGKYLPAEQLLVKGFLNWKIVRERHTLTDTALERLSKILSRHFEDRTIEMANCFMPHHAILIFKKRKISFVDICFGCRRISTTNDIVFDEGDMDKRKWSELEGFFLQKGLTYELMY